MSGIFRSSATQPAAGWRLRPIARHFVISVLGGTDLSDRREPLESMGSGPASPWTNSAEPNRGLAAGTPDRAFPGKSAFRISSSAPMLSPETIHRTGSNQVGAAIGAPRRCAGSRSTADYAAPGGFGAPRGRKSGAGPGAENPRSTACSEGEKRFRSATRNP